MNTQLLDQLVDHLVEQVARRLLELQQPPPQDDGGTPWMNVKTAATYLDWPTQRLYKLTAQNAIPHYKHEGRLLFNRQELDRWVREYAQHPLDLHGASSYQSHTPGPTSVAETRRSQS